jgi:D-cysteine desulfhydrase
MPLPKILLAHLPTPLFHHPELDRLVGAEVWVKRDDMSEAGASGNKIRKLEYLAADAKKVGATTLITCGGQQSNHARATALVAARLGLRCILLLRTPAPDSPPPLVGNLFIDELVGADVRFITPAQYREREQLMDGVARDCRERGEVPYVIPEGGSSGLGSLGYVDAMAEVRRQLDLGLAGGPRAFDAVVHACGSGGTAAGTSLGARRYRVATETHSIAVCDDRRYFDGVVARIASEAAALDPALDPSALPRVHDTWKGPAYGLATDEQLAFFVEVARKTGLLLDPVYSGKALFGAARLDPKPGRLLFLHTGGLPGLLAQSDAFAPLLRRSR